MNFNGFISEYLTDFNLTLIILLASAIFFMRGKVRTDIVAMGSLMALMFLNILTPNEALSGFSSSVVVMMVGLFIVGAGIFRTGLAKMISAKILKYGGKNEGLLFVLVMLVTSLIGAFVSNTGTVAVMMPIVISMAASGGMSTRRYLMPMAFASGMGMFTLISTPPNLVIQEALIEGGFKPLSFFSFAPVGAIAVSIGVFVLYFLSRLLKPKSETKEGEKRGKSLPELVEEYNLSMQMFKLHVPQGSAIANNALGELKIATTHFVSVVKVVHKRTTPRLLIRPINEEEAGSETVVREFDTLYCHGSIESVERFAAEYGLDIRPLAREEAMRHFSNYGIAEVFIMPNSNLINHTVKEVRFRELYNVTVLGIKRQGDSGIGEIREAKLHSGDALLIQGLWSDIAGLADRQEGDMVLVGQPAKEAAKVTLDSKAPMAAAIMLAMVVLMVLDIVPSVTAVLAAAGMMVLTGCIRNMEEAYESINWNSIVLIGAMIPMAIAFDKTGVTRAITDWLLYGMGDITPMALLAMIYGCTSILTLFMSNTATAVLFTPIAMQAAIAMGISPYPFLFAVAVAASMCFASPFSTPPNALVMSAGQYTFKDYVMVGLPLQLIMGIVMIFVLPLLFPF